MMRQSSRTFVGAPAAGVFSPDAALRFLDGELAALPMGVELVCALVAGEHLAEPVTIDPDDDERVLTRLSYQRLIPQLGQALASGAVVASERFRRTVDAWTTELALRGLRLERMLIEVGAIFAAVDIEFLVLKGVATSRLDHPQPGLRQAADVDALVRLDDVPRAGRALAAAGYVEPQDAATLMDKGETWIGPLGVSLDLHTRPHTAGRALPVDWWTRSEIFCVAGHEFRTLERGGRMAHAASHYALSFPNHRILSSLLDLVTIRRLANAEARARAEQFLAHVGVSDIVYRITSRAAALLEDPDLVLGRAGSRPLDLALRKAYDRSDLDKVALKLAKTFGMPRADKLRVARNWVAPSEDFLRRGGYTSRSDRLSQVLRRRWGPDRTKGSGDASGTR